MIEMSGCYCCCWIRGFTALWHISVQSVMLTTLFLGKPPRDSLPILSAVSFAINWQLQQRKKGLKQSHEQIFMKECAGHWGWSQYCLHPEQPRYRLSYRAQLKWVNWARMWQKKMLWYKSQNWDLKGTNSPADHLYNSWNYMSMYICKSLLDMFNLRMFL